METGANHKSLDEFPATWLRPDLWLEEKAHGRPDKPAILFADRAITYRELWERVDRLATGLIRTGLHPGDRIACLTTNHPAFLEIYFASSCTGAIFVPLNFRLAAEEILFQIEDAEPSILVLGPTREDLPPSFFQDLAKKALRTFHLGSGDQTWGGPRYDELFEEGPARDRSRFRRAFSSEDPQLIMYTSGTTGTPKGALLPFRKTLYNSLNAQRFFELKQEDRVLIAVPLFHSLGLNILSVPVLFQGGTVVLLERFEPTAALEAIERHRITFTGAVPTIYKDGTCPAFGSASRPVLRFPSLSSRHTTARASC
jgi:fatty-acyl-CoA synthase